MNVVDNRVTGLEVGDMIRFTSEAGNEYSFIVVKDSSDKFNTIWVQQNEIDFETGYDTLKEVYDYYESELTGDDSPLEIIKAKDVTVVIG